LNTNIVYDFTKIHLVKKKTPDTKAKYMKYISVHITRPTNAHV